MRALLLVLAVVSACKAKETKPAGTGATSATGITGATGATGTTAVTAGDAGVAVAHPDGGAIDGAVAAAPPVKLDAAARADLDAFLARWLGAQNGGDFVAYQALYASKFAGVRRTGDKVRRFDRAGWMKDRGAMFKRPMTVEATDVVAYASGDRRQLFFTQTWAQGSYKDVGTKNLVVIGKGDDIRLVYEELLESRIEKPVSSTVATAGADTAFGYDRAATVDTMRLARIDGTAVMLGFTSRSVDWVDPRVVDHEVDAASSSIGSAIVEGGIPSTNPLAALAVGKVTVLDEDLEEVCTGTLSKPSVRFAEFIDASDEDDAIARAKSQARFTIRAELTAPCKGVYVRGAAATAIPTPPDTVDVPDRSLRSIKTWDEGSQEATINSAVAGSSGYVQLIVHTTDACERQEGYRWTLFRATKSGKDWTLTEVESGEGDDDGSFTVLDVDGDSELDVITARGAYVANAWQSWDPDLRLYWPAGLGCDGCDDCGEEEEEMIGD